MAYQCIPLSTKEYNLVLGRILEHPIKAKKYNGFSEKYKSVSKAIKALESSEPDKHLLQIIENLKSEQKAAQEGMAKLLDSEFRAMQRELKRQGTHNKTPRLNCRRNPIIYQQSMEQI